MQKYPGQLPNSWKYHYDGFDYREDNHKTLRTKEYRCCVKGCKGRAVHPRDAPIRITVKSIHNHPRNSTNFRVWHFRRVLKEKAVKDLATPLCRLFRDLSREYADVAELVEPAAERRKMRRARMRMLPKCPDSYDELSTLLSTDENILKLYGSSDPVPDSGQEFERFFQGELKGPHGTTLVFASPHLLEKCLKPCKKAKLDATFSVLPGKPKGRQLLTLHATHGSYTFPVVYAMMQSKRKAAYIQLFEFIKVLCPQWNPTQLTADFEKGLRDAFVQVYPECEIVGCYFHYTQAVQKNWSQHGMMKVKRRMCTEAKELKRCIMALPFARAEDIPGIFEELTENVTLNLMRKVQGFLNYFQRTWLSKNNKNFQPSDWSVFGLPDRTNNHVESFHSTLQESHPTIWVFLKLLISINVEARQNFGRASNGIEIHPRIPIKILLNDERVANAKAMLEAGRISAFEYMMWCRTSTSATLAVVRQGRRLKRFIRANCNELQFDDVATSSDSSINSFDFDYTPNPHEEERMEEEDIFLNHDWLMEFNHEHIMGAGNENASDHKSSESSESLPPSDDSYWNNAEEEQDLALLHAVEDEEPIPVVRVPLNISAAARPPMSCLICLSEVATVIALNCAHALVCRGCKLHYTRDTCARCNQEIERFVDAILT